MSEIDKDEMLELMVDQIKEIFNLGLGYAAEEISMMVREDVVLSVPNTSILKRSELEKQFKIADDVPITAVFHSFSGDLIGDAILVFQEERCLELVRVLLNEESTLEHITELDEDALVDISSVILNGVLTAISGVLSVQLESSVPVCIHGVMNSVLNQLCGEHQKNDELFEVTIDFFLNENGINGKLLFLQPKSLAQPFLKKVENYICDNIL